MPNAAERHVEPHHPDLSIPFNEWLCLDFRPGYDLKCPECGRTWSEGRACRKSATAHRLDTHGKPTGPWQSCQKSATVVSLISDEEEG
ncbi:hypothetical protein N7499_000069 [Penicillium canescens]|uniref:Uncharacterized protein n=1 Tax=Penicillium canescens TaxID=5083 RepID=A0AAD6IG36_PENCN|nr:uncharacterized protein N7446_011730 [Penicillium canescens]KAJ6004003.1 hypothetical protein N7522_005648 [Penicillium canescens]KAJ6028929.1 hypothetical protein N7444_011916 [Penicillium canescens]KAJ6047363.1 hypothetical protein N7460_003510 [Penicillium canescens]KAJ6049047.1 hypothetical protein N7446_011730 [Penicillium canescens]KAJ6100439.1 hypothetical protein N7499_000069 [Penicillium canescens]